MWDRYHLGEALVALGDGVVLAAAVVGVGMVALRTGRPVLRSVADGITARWLGLVGVLGAVLAGVSGTPGARWAPWLAISVLVAVLADDPDRPHPLGRWTAVLTVVSLAGIWSAVPDTEPPLMAAMVLLPTALWWLRTDRSPGPVGSIALVVSAAGATWVGSAGWGSALATLGALGAVAVAPVVLGVGRRLGGSALVVVVGLHLVVALVVPRSIMRREVPVAVAVAVVVLLVLAGVTRAVARSNWARSSA